jgi:hypothetical protein
MKDFASALSEENILKCFEMMANLESIQEAGSISAAEPPRRTKMDNVRRLTDDLAAQEVAASTYRPCRHLYWPKKEGGTDRAHKVKVSKKGKLCMTVSRTLNLACVEIAYE